MSGSASFQREKKFFRAARALTPRSGDRPVSAPQCVCNAARPFG